MIFLKQNGEWLAVSAVRQRLSPLCNISIIRDEDPSPRRHAVPTTRKAETGDSLRETLPTTPGRRKPGLALVVCSRALSYLAIVTRPGGVPLRGLRAKPGA